jgi:hypothetical protein
LALTSPTSGGRSVGIVRWRTKPRRFFTLKQAVTIHWMRARNEDAVRDLPFTVTATRQLQELHTDTLYYCFILVHMHGKLNLTSYFFFQIGFFKREKKEELKALKDVSI